VGEPSAEGRWDVKVREHSPFKTRLVVIRPIEPHRFNGTVVVEWLNVTAGTDGAPDWSYTHTELIFISETDLMAPMGYLAARQDDNDYLRVWEVAGTAHADTYTVGASMIDSGSESIANLARALAPTTNVLGMQFDKPINSAPQHHYVMVAALAALNRWVGSGEPPAHAARLLLTDASPPQLARDPNGNATGGVRSPWLDVPTAQLSGLGQTGSRTGFLFGVTEPFDAHRLTQLYPGGRAEYLEKFGAALGAAIRAGFILPADEAQIKALASFGYPDGS
jgi:hypothetical protein